MLDLKQLCKTPPPGWTGFLLCQQKTTKITEERPKNCHHQEMLCHRDTTDMSGNKWKPERASNQGERGRRAAGSALSKSRHGWPACGGGGVFRCCSVFRCSSDGNTVLSLTSCLRGQSRCCVAGEAARSLLFSAPLHNCGSSGSSAACIN